MTERDTTSLDWEESDIEPHEAFSILSDPNRFDIIRVIAEAERETLPYNELYNRSNFDDSGQFTYHLRRLVGPFLHKADEGYGLRHAAKIVYRLAVSGLLSDRAEAKITTVDGTCAQCGAEQLAAIYEGDRFWIRCEACERRVTVAPFPPQALLNYEAERAPTAFDRYTMGTVYRAAENVCPWCASPLTPSLVSADEGWPAVDWVIHRTCDHCQGWIYTRIHDLLRFHPAVIAFYHEHGVDILGNSFWEAEEGMADQLIFDVDTDTWSAEAKLAFAGDEITLGIADDFRVSTLEVIETKSSS